MGGTGRQAVQIRGGMLRNTLEGGDTKRQGGRGACERSQPGRKPRNKRGRSMEKGQGLLNTLPLEQ